MSTSGAGLLGILLITHSRPGPKLVFHSPLRAQLSRKGVSEPTVDTNGYDELALDSFQDEPEDQKYARTNRPSGSHSHQPLPKEEGDSDTSRILGISVTTLEKVLSPGRCFDRKRFEVSIGDVLFLSHPVYADTNGKWKQKREEHEQPFDRVDGEEHPLTSTAEISGDVDGEKVAQSGITIIEPTPTKAKQDFTHVPESLQSQEGLSLATSINSESTASANISPEPLTAFQVIFALSRSRVAENNPAVSVIYEQIAKKLTKALAFLQKDSSYVGTESRKLSQVRTQAKQNSWTATGLQAQLVQRSELAWALDQMWQQLFEGETADFRLRGIPMSLQLQDATAHPNETPQVNRHSTILLTEDKDMLLRELAHPDAAPLAHFISQATPTKSLQKQTTSLGMPIQNLLHLARHLIIWRKARAITPLHPRNTYILTREAPLHHLDTHAKDYATLFPALPSLIQVLKVLSGKPLRWGLLIPSRDHRSAYMEILAFLVRHQFVELLKTSGWMQALPTPAFLSPISVADDAEVEANQNRRPLSVASLLSPQLRPQADDDVASVSSERTAIAISRPTTALKPHSLDGLRSGDRNVPSGATRNGVTSPEIIRDPLDPSTEDDLRLQHILEKTEDEELRIRLPALSRYFNGEEVLEEVAAKEGMKRSVFDGWLDWLNGRGFVVTFRWV